MPVINAHSNLNNIPQNTFNFTVSLAEASDIPLQGNLTVLLVSTETFQQPLNFEY